MTNPTTRVAVVKDGETEGVSPKAVLATVLPLVVGVVLLALDLLEVIAVDDTLWQALLASGPLAGLGAAAGKTGTVVDTENTNMSLGNQVGQSWVTFLFALAALAIIVFVVVALAK